jgi:hypothetical protein
MRQISRDCGTGLLGPDGCVIGAETLPKNALHFGSLVGLQAKQLSK